MTIRPRGSIVLIFYWFLNRYWSFDDSHDLYKNKSVVCSFIEAFKNLQLDFLTLMYNEEKCKIFRAPLGATNTDCKHLIYLSRFCYLPDVCYGNIWAFRVRDDWFNWYSFNFMIQWHAALFTKAQYIDSDYRAYYYI